MDKRRNQERGERLWNRRRMSEGVNKNTLKGLEQTGRMHEMNLSHTKKEGSWSEREE